ncbi:MAG: hypothetical protein A2Y33_10290 [Spirochaetes bacterium GWF1_51_8]|nr:MAG: hypothetical protein A2Y33_10290 [Spirochaetes bacterium GWF1_51_8]
MKKRFFAIMGLLVLGFFVGCDITITSIPTKTGFFTFTNGVLQSSMLELYYGTAPSSWKTGNLIFVPVATGSGRVLELEVGTWDSLMKLSNIIYPELVYTATYAKSTLFAVQTPVFTWFYTNMDMSFVVEEGKTNTNNGTMIGGYLGISNVSTNGIYIIKLTTGTSWDILTPMETFINGGSQGFGKIEADSLGALNSPDTGTGYGVTPYQLAMGTYYITIENRNGSDIGALEASSTFPVSILSPGTNWYVLINNQWTNI